MNIDTCKFGKPPGVVQKRQAWAVTALPRHPVAVMQGTHGLVGNILCILLPYSVQKRHRVGRAGPSTLRGREWVVEVGLSWRLGRDRHNPPQRTLTLVTQWGRAPTPLQPALFFSVRLTERPVGDKISLPGVQTGADRGTRGEGA